MTSFQQIATACLVAAVVLGSLESAQAGKGRFHKTVSPDGSLVAFVSNVESGHAKIFVERADGTGRVQLTDKTYSDTAPEWSPDGKRIAFMSDRNGRWQLYVMDRDGTHVAQLSRDDTANSDGSPSWSPDGKRIAFASNRSDKWQVYTMDVDGANVEELSHDDTGATRPQYAPGGRLAFLAERGTASLAPLYDLVIVEGDKRTTLRAKSPIKDFAWCHDELIAYGVGGEIVFHDFAKGTDRTVRLVDIDARLDSHAAFEFRWQPMQKVLSCRIRFMGGVPEGTIIYGDNQLLTITPTGMAQLMDREDES
jgi:dipeptidyl aminopeptidase/acylaminoacyl peptidase